MSALRNLYWGRTSYDFVGTRKRWFVASGIIVAVAVLAFILRSGFDLSVDFEGGTMVAMENPNAVSVADVRDAVEGLGIAGARIQEASGGDIVRVQAPFLEAEVEDELVAVLAELTGSDPEDASRQSVGPTFGRHVADAALRALIVFLIVSTLYMAWRLKWKMGVIATAALFHDLIFTAGVYLLVGFEVSPATVIAVLTVLGYSLYDTVILFDKVLELAKERGDRQTISSIVNESTNQILMRSIMTTSTTLLPIGSLLLIGSFLLGATTLREFALALFIGVAVGAYSTIFLAAPLYAIWAEREPHWQRVRQRVERKGGDATFATREVFVPTESAEPTTALPSGVVPRPPKKRKKKR